MALNLLGRREWFGILALGIAVAIAAMFVNEGSGTRDTGPVYGPDGEGLEVVSSPDESGGTDWEAIPGSPSWVVSIFDTSSGQPVLSERTLIDHLDFTFNGPIFPDLTDDQWSMVAEWSFEAPAGHYRILIEAAGDIIVSVGGRTEISPGAHLAEPRMLELLFDHPGGTDTLRIEARDTRGPFMLRWLDPGGHTATSAD